MWWGEATRGCEAALAAARMGSRTLLLTMNLDTIGLMPCNPSIGGPAKGNLVREIDALGGEMARAIDDTFIHIRTLNTGKGPAVQALRAQADKAAYSLRMKMALECQAGLQLKQAMVDGLLMEDISQRPSALSTQRGRVRGVVTSLGRQYRAKAVVLTTGTSLRGRVIVGDQAYSAGRSGEQAAMVLPDGLRALGLELGRLKTGTPPRVDARTVDLLTYRVDTREPQASALQLLAPRWGGLPAISSAQPCIPPGRSIALAPAASLLLGLHQRTDS